MEIFVGKAKAIFCFAFLCDLICLHFFGIFTYWICYYFRDFKALVILSFPLAPSIDLSPLFYGSWICWGKWLGIWGGAECGGCSQSSFCKALFTVPGLAETGLFSNFAIIKWILLTWIIGIINVLIKTSLLSKTCHLKGWDTVRKWGVSNH